MEEGRLFIKDRGGDNKMSQPFFRGQLDIANLQKVDKYSKNKSILRKGQLMLVDGKLGVEQEKENTKEEKENTKEEKENTKEEKENTKEEPDRMEQLFPPQKSKKPLQSKRRSI